MFISSYTTIYFFVKNFLFRMFIFQWIRLSHPLSMYITRVIQNVYRCAGGQGYHTSSVRTHLHHLFSCFCLMVSCFICRNLTLPSFKKSVFVRNGYFSPKRSISVAMKSDFFTLNCFSKPKLAKTLLILTK